MKLNKRGNTLIYVMFIILFIITLIITFNNYRANSNISQAQANLTDKEQEFLNTFERKVKNRSLVNLYEPTVIRETFQGKEYIAEIQPSGKLETKPVKETFTFNWDEEDKIDDKIGPKIKGITYNSTSNIQQLAFAGTTDFGDKQKGIIGSQKADNIELFTPFTGTLANENFASGVAVKANYRMGEGEKKTATGYPLNKSLDLSGSKNKDIISIDYLDKNGKLVGWSRFINNNTIEHSSYQRFLLSRLPNSNRVVGGKEITSLIEEVNKQIGGEVQKTYNSHNTLALANAPVKVCYYWESYGDFSSLRGSNDTKPKFAVDYEGSPCEQNRYWDFNMNISGVKINPWINGFHNIQVSKVNEIKAYSDPNYPNPAFESNWRGRFYCSDPSVQNETKRKLAKATADFRVLWDKAVEKFNADVRKAYDEEKTEYPSWSSYEPPFPPKPISIPCISEASRDDVLVQYEEDEKLISQLSINLVNNITTEYTIDIEHSIDVEKYPVKWTTHYTEGDNPYKIEDTGDNRTFKKGETQKMSITRKINKNYNYSNMDLIGTYDQAKASITPRSFNLALENSKVSKVTLTTKEFKSAEFKFRIKNSNGIVLRDKKIIITDGQ